MRLLYIALAALALLSAGAAPVPAAPAASLETLAETRLMDQSGRPAALASPGENTLIVYYRGEW